MCVLKALNRCSPHQWTMFLLEDMNYENISAWYELFSPKHPKFKRSLSLLLDAHHNSMVKPYCWRHHTLVAGHRKLDLELTKNLFVYWIVFIVIRSPMQCPGRKKRINSLTQHWSPNATIPASQARCVTDTKLGRPMMGQPPTLLIGPEPCSTWGNSCLSYKHSSNPRPQSRREEHIYAGLQNGHIVILHL